MKKLLHLLWILPLCMSFYACSSDDDDFGVPENGKYPVHHKYSFVGKTYYYQYTHNGEPKHYQYLLTFPTDSTFSFNPINTETGESLRDHPGDGTFVVDNEGLIILSGVEGYLTKLRGQRISLYKARFSKTDPEILEVNRTLYFNTGNKRNDWIDFHLKK